MSALPSIAEAKHAYLFWEAALSSDEVRQLREWRHAMHALKLEDESVRTRIPITDYRDMKFVQRQHEAQKAEHARIRRPSLASHNPLGVFDHAHCVIQLQLQHLRQCAVHRTKRVNIRVIPPRQRFQEVVCHRSMIEIVCVLSALCGP